MQFRLQPDLHNLRIQTSAQAGDQLLFRPTRPKEIAKRRLWDRWLRHRQMTRILHAQNTGATNSAAAGGVKPTTVVDKSAGVTVPFQYNATAKTSQQRDMKFE